MDLVRDSDNGSSPHTRGAQSETRPPESLRGIIPAYAGSTWRKCSSSPTTPDHPRIRGEHSFEKLPSAMARGSSPHTRGARRSADGVDDPWGIIPAYAGSTVLDFEDRGAGDGSSPHTRGALGPPPQPTSRRRIIPAYAGSTAVGVR